MVLGQDAMAFTLKLDIRKKDPSVGTQRQGKLEVTGGSNPAQTGW